MAQQNISVQFTANIAQFQKAMSKVASSVSGAAETVSNKAKGMADALKPVSASVAALGGASVAASMQVNEASNNLKTKLGANTKDAELLEQSINNIAATGVGSIGEVTDALVIAKHNFKDLDGKELESVTTNAMNLSDVMGEDVGSVMKTASVLAKKFGITTDEAFDLLAAGYQNGMNYSGDFLDTITEYSGYFSSLGFDAKDMFNVLISGAEEGAFNLDKVGDAVKEFGIRSKDGSDATADAFTALGYDAAELTKIFAEGGEPAQQAYLDVVKSLSEVEDEVTRNAIGVALFGTQYEDMEKDVIASTAYMTDHLGDYGGTAQQVAKDNETFGKVLKGAMNEASIAIAPLGDALLEIAKKVIPPMIDGVKKVSDAFVNLSPNMQGVVIGIGGLVAIAPVLLTAFATIVGFIPNIVNGFKMIVTVFKVLRTVFLTNPFVLVITAIVVVAILIYKYWDEILVFLKAAWEWIKTTAIAVWNGIKSFFISVWNSIKNAAIAIFNGIKAYFKFVFNAYKTIIMAVWNSIKFVLTTIWNGIKFVATTIFNGLKIYIKTVFNIYKTIIMAVWNGIRNALKAIWNGIKAVASSVFNGIKTVITTVFNTTKNGVISTVTSLKNGVSNIFNAIKNTASNIFNSVKTAMTNPITAAKDKIKGIIDAIKGFFSGLSLKFPSIKMPKLPKFSLKGDFSLNPPSVPKLGISWHQNGGIIKGSHGGTIVGVGENGGDEAILPLSNKSRMKPFAQAVASMMPEANNPNQSFNGELTINVPVVIDGREIAKATVKFNQEELANYERKQNRLSGQI